MLGDSHAMHPSLGQKRFVAFGALQVSRSNVFVHALCVSAVQTQDGTAFMILAKEDLREPDVQVIPKQYFWGGRRSNDAGPIEACIRLRTIYTILIL